MSAANVPAHPRRAESRDTEAREHGGARERVPVRRVQPDVIRLVEPGFLTDEARDHGSDARFTPGQRASAPFGCWAAR